MPYLFGGDPLLSLDRQKLTGNSPSLAQALSDKNTLLKVDSHLSSEEASLSYLIEMSFINTLNIHI